MVSVAQLVGKVVIEGAEKSIGQLEAVGATVEGTQSKLNGIALGAAVAVGAALIGIGAKAVTMAGDFQQATNQLITSAGETRQNIDAVRQGILDLSVSTATSWQQLVAGMYNIESAGYHGAAALDILKAAAQGAKAENADLAAVTDVLTTAMHNYHISTSQSVDVMNTFIRTTAEGKMHMDDLTAAFKNVLQVSSIAKVHLTDVEAALAEMSLAGDKGAAAGTHLSQMLTYLLAPSSKATKVLKEIGLTTQQISDEMKVSLPGTIEMITDAVGKKFPKGSAAYIAALSAIVGGNKSMKAMLELSGQSLEDFKKKAQELAPVMKENAKSVENWGLIQSNFNFKVEQAKNAVDAMLITIGEKLLPVLGRVLDTVTPLIAAFANWAGSGHALNDVLKFFNDNIQITLPILAGLAAMLLAVLIPAVWSLAAGVIAATWPLLAIGAAVAGVTALLVFAYQHWSGFHDAVDAVGRILQQFVSGILPAVNTGLHQLGQFIDQVSQGFQAAFTTIGGGAASFHEVIAPFFDSFDRASGIFKTLHDTSRPLFDTFDRGKDILHKTGQNAQPLLDSFDRASGIFKTFHTNAKPLFDTFDRGKDILHKTGQNAQPLLDSFDRASGIFSKTHASANPMLDSFDRAPGIFSRTHASAQHVTDTINPWYTLFSNVRDVFDRVGSALGSVVGFLARLWPAVQQLGQFVATTFAPVWDQLATTWRTQLLPSFQQLYAAMIPLMPFLQGFAYLIGGIVVLALIDVIATLAGLVKALANFLGGIAVFVGGVAEFFTGIVQIVSGFLQLIGDLFSGNLSGISKDWDMMWQGMVNISKGFGDICAGLFQAVFGAIIGFVEGFVTVVIGLFTALYNALVGHSIIPNLVNGIVSWFAQLPGRVAAFISSLIGRSLSLFASFAAQAISWAIRLVSGFVSSVSALPGRAASAISGLGGALGSILGGVANQAVGWGARITNNVAAGIRSSIGNAISAAQSLAASVANFLPHSPAKEGPLKRLNEFGPALVKGFSQGIIDSTPTLRAAVTHMVQPTVPGSPQFTPSVAVRSTGQAPQIIVQSPDIYVDGYRLAKVLAPHQVELIRSHASSHGW